MVEPGYEKGSSIDLFSNEVDSKNTVDNLVEKNDDGEKIEWILSQPTVAIESVEGSASLTQKKIIENSSPASAASGGYLAKPSNIYAEPKIEKSVTDHLSVESTVVNPLQEEEPSPDMQLVFKDDIPAAEEPRAHQIQQPVMDMPSVEDLLCRTKQKFKGNVQLNEYRNCATFRST